MKKRRRKLTLQKTTIRSLDDLRVARGGIYVSLGVGDGRCSKTEEGDHAFTFMCDVCMHTL